MEDEITKVHSSLHRSVYVKEGSYLHGVNERIVVFMLGLPARGKSYISKKLRRYLQWIGYEAKVFNVGDRRRQMTDIQQDATFFNFNIQEHVGVRDKLALDVLDELILWLDSREGGVGIHDATNCTRKRRELLLSRMAKSPHIKVLFIESLCTDKSLLDNNVMLKINSPDYKNMNKDLALDDFKARLQNYEKSYEPMGDNDEDHLSYIKLINVGRQVLANNIHGHLPSQMVMFLMNYHVHPRTIWLTRHGESIANTQGLLGGDSALSTDGHRYAKALAKFVELHPEIRNVPVWTSTLHRTKQTVSYLSPRKVMYIPALNEIFAGACEGMTYKQIEEKMPSEYEARQTDKLRYRYPAGGESYMDLIERIKPLIVELERTKENLLIVAHQAVARCLISYFIDIPKKKMPLLEVPLHTIFRLTPTPFGCMESQFIIDTEKFEKGENVFWTAKDIVHNY